MKFEHFRIGFFAIIQFIIWLWVLSITLTEYGVTKPVLLYFIVAFVAANICILNDLRYLK